jgi:hypothetical protein
LLHAAMRRRRVIEAEVLQAAREGEAASLDQVEAMVLGTDVSFSALTRRPDPGARSSPEDVPGAAAGRGVACRRWPWHGHELCTP